MTMFRLSVAFPEIEYGTSLSVLCSYENEDEISTARRLAMGTGMVSSKYRGMTDRLLYCDFGHGDKLNDTTPQSVVYNDVSCLLGEMHEVVAV